MGGSAGERGMGPAVTGVEAAVVSPAGDAIAFRRPRGPDAGLYCYAVDTGAVALLGTEAALGPTVDHLAWTLDGTSVLYHRAGGCEGPDVWAVDRSGTVRPVIDGEGASLLTDVGPDGLLYLDRRGFDLYRCAADGNAVVPLRTDDAGVFGAKFGPAGGRVAYTAIGAEQDEATVHVTDLDGGDHAPVPVGESAGVRDWGADGILVEVESMAATAQNIGWVSVPAKAAASDTAPIEATLHTIGSVDCIEHPLGWLPDGRILAERRTRDGTLVPVLYDRSGNADVVCVAPGLSDFAGEGYGARLADGTLVVEAETPARPRALLRFDPEDGAVASLVAPAGWERGDGARGVDATHDVVESADGTRIGVIRCVPSHAPSPRPVVLRIPDRPRAQAWRAFHRSDRTLLERGIEVVWVNQRGATAYLGETPGLANGFGRDDQADIVAVARWLAGRAAVDADQIAIAGRYYGGYTALLQLCLHPTTYACGVAWDAIADLRTFREDDRASAQVVGAIERWLEGCDGDAWRERSPIAHVGALSAPIGLVHRIDDGTVPHAQTESVRRAIADRGSDYEHRRIEDDEAGYRFLVDFLTRRLSP